MNDYNIVKNKNVNYVLIFFILIACNKKTTRNNLQTLEIKDYREGVYGSIIYKQSRSSPPFSQWDTSMMDTLYVKIIGDSIKFQFKYYYDKFSFLKDSNQFQDGKHFVTSTRNSHDEFAFFSKDSVSYLFGSSAGYPDHYISNTAIFKAKKLK
jgi:hypothetical protein